MTTSPQHETHVEYIPEGDEMLTIPASLLIRTLSYYEQLGSEKTEREVRTITSHLALLADVARALEVIKNKKTPELQITVTTDKYGEPKLIKHRYVLNSKSYGRQ